MCDLLVFAADDITPEHWADFIKTADLAEEIIGKKNPAYDPTPPYTLVHSHSQENFSRTGEITQPVKTDFKDATYAEIFEFVDKIEKSSRSIINNPVLVLDKKSEEDRKVVLIQKTSRTLYAMLENAKNDEEDVEYEGADDILGRKHRIPFEKVAFFWTLILGQPADEGDDFLQNTTYGTMDGL